MFESQKLGNAQTGITLVELIVTIVILAIALLGIAQAIQGGAQRSADTLVEGRAIALAQAYLDEILGKRFDENSANSGIPPCRPAAPVPRQCTAEGSFGFNFTSPVEPGENSRSKLDDVDDYDGMDEGDGQTTPLQDVDGNDRNGYENFRVQVAVRYINVAMIGDEEFDLKINNELGDEHDAKLITVTVSHRAQPQGYKFSAYKANF
ncbi:MAG: type II secretion system protein [Pseudohongiella sp.]|nr:type II secretion system protein [Pseudohongiella sp.]